MTNHHDHCLIDRSAPSSMYEFVAYRGSLQNPTDGAWPSSPGAVRFDNHSRPLLLHFAPGRWLAPEPSPQTLALLNDAAGSGAGTLMNVTGKWDAIRICGPGAMRLLACTVNCELVLDNRGCAAATLFDCPAILMRTADGFSAWVQSSYAGHFLATAEQFRAALGNTD